jgi:hypothetical protein
MRTTRALGPEKPRSKNVPSPASAGVYTSATNPVFITGATTSNRSTLRIRKRFTISSLRLMRR